MIENVQFIAAMIGPYAIGMIVLLAIAIALWALAWAVRTFIGEFIYDVGIGAEDFGNVIVHIVDWVMKLFHKHPRPGELTFAEKIRFLKNSHACDPYDSYSATILYPIRHAASSHICPTLRYMYGTSIGSFMSVFVGWLSFDPAPEGANCVKPGYAAYCLGFIELWRFFIFAVVFGVVSFVVGVGMPLVDQVLLITFRAAVFASDVIYYAVRVLLFIIHPHLRRDRLPK